MKARTIVVRISFTLIGLAGTSLPLSAAEPADAGPVGTTALSATYIKAAEVNTAARSLSSLYTDDEPVRVVNVGTYNVGLFVVGRPKRTGPTVSDEAGATRVTEGQQLDHVTVVLNILSGGGTLVTGGTLTDARRMAPDDPDLPVVGPGNRGKVIRGGTSQGVGPGDTIIIPARVVHGFSEVREPLTYSAIRIDVDRVLPLK